MYVPGVVPNIDPPDKVAALQAVKYQIAFSLLWYQCKSGVQIDTTRAHQFCHGVVEETMKNWSSENKEVVGDGCDLIASCQFELQNTLEDSMEIEPDFNMHAWKEHHGQ